MSIFDGDKISTQVSVEGVEEGIAKLDQLTEAQKRQIDATKAAEDRYVDSVRKRSAYTKSVEDVRAALRDETAAIKGSGEAAKGAAEGIGALIRSKIALGTALATGGLLLFRFIANTIESTKAAASFGDEIQKMVERTGKGAAELQSLGYAAKQSGTDLKSVIREIDDLNSKLIKGRSDNPEQDARTKFVFKQLGLDPKSLKDGETAFMALADKIREFKPDDRAQIAKALGISPDMLQMLNKGSEEIARMRDEYSRLSPITAEAAKASSQLSDEWERSKQIGAAWGREVWNAIGPYIAKILTGFNDIRAAAMEMGGGTINKLMNTDVALTASVRYGAPGSDTYKKGIDAEIANLQRLRKEQAEFQQYQRDNPISGAVRGFLSSDAERKIAIKDGERMLDVMLLANQRATERIKIQERADTVLEKSATSGKTFQPYTKPEREGREKSDPDDQLRRLMERMRIEMDEAAGVLDSSPEAKRYFSAYEQIFAPGNKFSREVQKEAIETAAARFIAERGKATRDMMAKDAAETAAAWERYYADQDAVRDASDKALRDRADRIEKIAQAARDAADPISAYAREWARVNAELEAHSKALSPAEMDALRENIASGVKGLKQELKQDDSEIKELLRDLGNFGRNVSDRLADGLGRGSDAVKKFAEDIGKIALKRVLYESIGKPLDNFIVALLQAGTKGSGDGGIASGLGLAFRTIFGMWADSSGGYTSDIGVMPKNSARGNVLGKGSVSFVGEQGPELAYVGPTGTQIIPLGGSGQSSGGGYNVGNLTINIDGSTDRAQIQRMVKRGVMEGMYQLREEAQSGGPMAKAVGKE